jgi:hypothetical protein
MNDLRQTGTLPSKAMSERLMLQSLLEAAHTILDVCRSQSKEHDARCSRFVFVRLSRQ